MRMSEKDDGTTTDTDVPRPNNKPSAFARIAIKTAAAAVLVIYFVTLLEIIFRMTGGHNDYPLVALNTKCITDEDCEKTQEVTL